METMSKQQTISAEEYREMIKPGKQNKYRNKPKEYKGRTYHSTLEANYAAELDLKIKAGIVKQWQPQHKLSIDVNGQHVCNYFIDFRVEYTDGTIELVECKGKELPDWKLKWKLVHILIDDIEPGAILILKK